MLTEVKILGAIVLYLYVSSIIWKLTTFKQLREEVKALKEENEKEKTIQANKDEISSLQKKIEQLSKK